MPTFTDRPPISAHVRTRFTVAHGARPHRLNVVCGVCGPIATVSAFRDIEAEAGAAMGQHVALVTALMDLPDTPSMCLACKPNTHRNAKGWTYCRRHARMTLIDAVRTHWLSGDVRRLVRAWVDVEDEYGPAAEEIGAEDFAADWDSAHAAVQAAYQTLPRLEAAAEAGWRQQAARRAADLGRWPYSVDYGDSGDDPAYYPESQSTMSQTDA